MLSLDCYIGLEVSLSLDREIVRDWFNAVRDNAPDGILRVAQTTDDRGGLRSVAMVAREREGRYSYMVPLSRHLNQDEAERIIGAFDLPETDYDIAASSSYSDANPGADQIELDGAEYGDLCTAWAKRQHDVWMSDRIAAGWRYGPTVSVSQRTHPLLVAWAELPPEQRKVDFEAPNKLIGMLGDQGYVVISRGELETIRNLLRIK